MASSSVPPKKLFPSNDSIYTYHPRHPAPDADMSVFEVVGAKIKTKEDFLQAREQMARQKGLKNNLFLPANLNPGPKTAKQHFGPWITMKNSFQDLFKEPVTNNEVKGDLYRLQKGAKIDGRGVAVELRRLENRRVDELSWERAVVLDFVPVKDDKTLVYLLDTDEYSLGNPFQMRYLPLGYGLSRWHPSPAVQLVEKHIAGPIPIDQTPWAMSMLPDWALMPDQIRLLKETLIQGLRRIFQNKLCLTRPLDCSFDTFESIHNFSLIPVGLQHFHQKWQTELTEFYEQQTLSAGWEIPHQLVEQLVQGKQDIICAIRCKSTDCRWFRARIHKLLKEYDLVEFEDLDQIGPEVHMKTAERHQMRFLHERFASYPIGDYRAGLAHVKENRRSHWPMPNTKRGEIPILTPMDHFLKYTKLGHQFSFIIVDYDYKKDLPLVSVLMSGEKSTPDVGQKQEIEMWLADDMVKEGWLEQTCEPKEAKERLVKVLDLITPK